MKRIHELLASVALVGLGGEAGACINDNESSSHEREFRSQYSGIAGTPTLDEFANKYPNGLNLLIGGGAALLTASVVLTVKRARPRA